MRKIFFHTKTEHLLKGDIYLAKVKAFEKGGEFFKT
jgi:Ribonuclease G/E